MRFRKSLKLGFMGHLSTPYLPAGKLNSSLTQVEPLLFLLGLPLTLPPPPITLPPMLLHLPRPPPHHQPPNQRAEDQNLLFQWNPSDVRLRREPPNLLHSQPVPQPPMSPTQRIMYVYLGWFLTISNDVMGIVWTLLLQCVQKLALSPGHSQFLSRSCGAAR